MEKRKRFLCYQLVITENYQKAINQELGQLVQWVSLNIRELTSSSEEDFSKNYKAVCDQLSRLHRTSEELYKILQETKAGLSSPSESLYELLDGPLTKLLLFPTGAQAFISLNPAVLDPPGKGNVSMSDVKGSDRYSPELHTPQVKPTRESGQCWGESTTQAMVQKVNRANGTKSLANVQPLKVNKTLDAPAPPAGQTPELHVAGLTVAKSGELHHEDPTSEILLQEERNQSPRPRGDGGSFPNSQSAKTDTAPNEALCSQPPDGRNVAKDERLLSVGTSARTSPALGDDCPVLSKQKPSEGLTRVARSKHEVWDTFEFSLSSVSDWDARGDIKISEKRESGGHVWASTGDVSSSQEPLSPDESFRESAWAQPCEQVVTGAVAPQCSNGPYYTLSQTPNSLPSETPINNQTMERLPDVPKFQYCPWQELEVRVSHVIDPQHFYIQHCGHDLPALMRELNAECSWSCDKLACLPSIGCCVSAWLPDTSLWYRARVVCVVVLKAATGDDTDTDYAEEEAGPVMLELLCVDYGFSVCLPFDSLKYLNPALRALPQQALLVSLANVSPLGGRVWSRLVVGWFRNTVENRTFFARFYPDSDRMVVELFSDRGKIGIVRRGSKLSQRLVEAGIATHSDTCCVSPKVGASIPLQWKQRLVKYLIQPNNVRK